MLGNIVSNYKELWMFFKWFRKEVVLKGENPVRFQTLKFDQQHVGQSNLDSRDRLA
jgi:hypothetical protein